LKLFLAGKKIPFVSLDKNRKAKKKLTQRKNKVWEPLIPVICKYEEVFHKLGFKSDVHSKQYRLSKLSIPDNFGPTQPGDRRLKIGIAPFAAHSGKCYPQNLMEQLIDGISNKLSCTILLFGGGKKETDKLTKWENKYTNCISLAGKGTLHNELAVISNLNLMVSMDSGNGHLAAMFGIPVITLWGVTHPYAGFAPYFQAKENSITADRNLYPEIPTSIYGNRVPKGYECAMSTIEPEQVVRRVLEALNIQHSL
jgi:ADP-heptose:LPS heptosyltransferase